MKWVSIEGVMSSGKSTLAALLQEELSALVVPEPVEEWEKSGILAASYLEPQKYSFPAQLVFFTSRIAAFKRIVSTAATSLVISDGSCFSDKGYWNTKLARGDVEPMLHTAYMDMWKEWQNLLPIRKPHLFVYLDIDIDECMRRLRQRNREAELSVDDSYLRTLKAEQDKIFLDPLGVLMPDGSRVPCLIIDAMPNFERDASELSKIVVSLRSKLK